MEVTPVRSSSPRLGSAKEFHDSELPSPRSALSVVSIVQVVGLAAFGEAGCLHDRVHLPFCMFLFALVCELAALFRFNVACSVHRAAAILMRRAFQVRSLVMPWSVCLATLARALALGGESSVRERRCEQSVFDNSVGPKLKK